MTFRKQVVWGGVLLGGAIGVALVNGTVCACTMVPPHQPPIRTFLGRTFRDLAAAEEDLHRRSGHYASSAADLASVALPPETRIVDVSGSTADFRVKLDSASLSCFVSGGRTFLGQVLPFSLDCRRPAAKAP